MKWKSEEEEDVYKTHVHVQKQNIKRSRLRNRIRFLSILKDITFPCKI